MPDRPLRITFLLAAMEQSGGVRAVVQHAKCLMNRGHQVLVAFPPPGQLSLRQKLSRLRHGAAWSPKRVADTTLLKDQSVPYQQLSTHRKSWNTQLPDADIIVASWFGAGEDMCRLPESKGVHALLIQGDDRDVLSANPSMVERVEQLWQRPMCKIAVSNWVAARVRQVNPEANVAVVGNGVDHNQFHAPNRAMNSNFTLGYLHSRTPCKGGDLAFQAICLAQRELPLRIVSFGNTQPEADFPLPTGAHFSLKPSQQNIRNIYAQCDAWLFPSRAEGFGLPILESMACRTPVIATPAGAAPSILADGAGLLLPDASPATMAVAILQVARLSPAAWLALSTAAWQRSQQYSWDASSLQLESVLREALTTSAPNPLPEMALQ